MARPCFFFAVLVLAALALAAPSSCKRQQHRQQEQETDYKTKAALSLIAEGEALIPLFGQQFNSSLDAYKDRYIAAQQDERQSASAANKAAVNKLVDRMYDATCVMYELCSALREQKIKELTTLMKQYRALITSRLTATGDEAVDAKALLAQRWRKQHFTVHWERDQIAAMVKAINAHQQAAEKVYKSLEDADDSVKVAIRAVTDRLMQKLIDEVSELLNLTTVSQFPQVEDFAVKAGRLLFKLAVSAKARSM